jgi:hypothetical protein
VGQRWQAEYRHINSDLITVELVEPIDAPAVVVILWPHANRVRPLEVPDGGWPGRKAHGHCKREVIADPRTEALAPQSRSVRAAASPAMPAPTTRTRTPAPSMGLQAAGSAGGWAGGRVDALGWHAQLPLWGW